MSDCDDVLRRWNPRGWRSLHDPQITTVRITGLSGSGVTTLAEELRHLGVDVVREGPAAVALVVFDPSAVLGRTELGIFDDATTGTTEVVCALTGIDRYPEWESVRDSDIDLLHRHAPWVRPVMVPVSAEAARRARQNDDCPAGGEALRAASGMAELRDVLVAAVRSAGDRRRARGTVVARTRRMIDEEIDRLHSQDDAVALRAERSRLAATPHPSVQRPDLHRLQAELLHEVAVGLRAASVATIDDAEASRKPAETVATVDAHLDDLRARLADALATVGEPGPPPTTRAPLPGTGRSLEDTLTAVFGASAGAGAARLLLTVFGELPGWVALVVAVACAVPVAGWLVHVRRRIARRDRMRRWVADELAGARAELDTWVRTRMHDAEMRLAGAATSARDERTAHLRERLAVLDAEIARHQGERRARLAACERDLAALAAEPHPSGTRPTR